MIGDGQVSPILILDVQTHTLTVSFFSIHKFITGRIGWLRERTGFGFGMDFMCNFIRFLVFVELVGVSLGSMEVALVTIMVILSIVVGLDSYLQLNRMSV